MTAAQAAAAAAAAALGSNSSSWRNSCTGQGSNAEQSPASGFSMLMACIEELAAFEGLSSAEVSADGDAASMLRGGQCFYASWLCTGYSRTAQYLLAWRLCIRQEGSCTVLCGAQLLLGSWWYSAFLQEAV